MTDILKSPTSAAGTFLVRQLREPLVIGLIALGVGTSAYSSPSESEIHALRQYKQTTAGAAMELRNPAAKSISELRRLTGFTWEQLARLFNVSRRSLHFWASGNRMAAANEEHLERVLAVVRLVDRGSADANRAALLASQGNGVTPFDELAHGRYDSAISKVGRGTLRSPIGAPILSPAAKAARMPRPPEELVDAFHDRVHEESGQSRPAKSVRTERGG